MQTGLTYFREHLKQLPLDVREAIVNTDYLSAMEEIQEAQKLHIDQAASMEELTFKLMLGELDTSDYAAELSKAINLDSQKTSEIVKLVDEKIMKPIRDELHDIQDQELLNEDAEHPIQVEDDSSEISHEEVLAGIENPEPSMAVSHEVTVPVTKTPEVKITPVAPVVPTSQPKAETIPVATPTQPQIPVGWPAPKNATTPAAPQQTPQTIANLGQKLQQPTVSRPTEIKQTIDPYKEPLE